MRFLRTLWLNQIQQINKLGAARDFSHISKIEFFNVFSFDDAVETQDFASLPVDFEIPIL